MVKRKAKKQSKRKKVQKESNIRTDVWQLKMTQEQRQLAILTVAEYRYFLKPLVLISYWNWVNLSGLTSNERVNTLEKLVHKTADNPSPKYHGYFQKAISNHPFLLPTYSVIADIQVQAAMQYRAFGCRDFSVLGANLYADGWPY